MVEKVYIYGEDTLVPTYTQSYDTYVCDDCGARGSEHRPWGEDLDDWVHGGGTCPVVDALIEMHKQGYPLDDVIQPGFLAERRSRRSD